MVVLAGSAPGEVLAAVGRSMNVTLIRPEEPADSAGDAIETAAGALQRAGRAMSPYALVPADPLAAVAASWQAMWDVSRQQGPAEFEQEAAKALAAWRAGRFELPDYYLVSPRVPVPPLVPSTAPITGRISASGRCARPGRTGWRSSPRRNPLSRPRASCAPSAHCGMVPGGQAWTR